MSKQREEDLDTSLSGDESASGQAAEQRTKWYKRIRKGITTSTAEKKETPEGLWSKCPECNYICTTAELKENLFVCPKCNYHHRIGSEDYYEIIFDNNEWIRFIILQIDIEFWLKLFDKCIFQQEGILF